MKIGMLLPSAGQQATRENIIQAAKQAEQEGFDSLWVWERLISPLKPQTPYPLTLPIYMGVFSPKAFGRAVKYADGWIGMFAGTLDDFENAVNTIRDMAINE
jgi:alkanesulfonate monooxygenase SsuD/methylene tetrahydromethanopterin reductase-like flavin-dependent oxidoreductase (luciferase family)